MGSVTSAAPPSSALTQALYSLTGLKAPPLQPPSPCGIAAMCLIPPAKWLAENLACPLSTRPLDSTLLGEWHALRVQGAAAE